MNNSLQSLTLKSMVIILITTVTQLSFAHECKDKNGNDIIDQPDHFISLIENAKSCREATHKAKACAWGSSIDTYTVSAAINVCNRELYSYSPDKKLLEVQNRMINVCAEKYANESGTMFSSLWSYCELSAIAWIVELAYPY